MRSHAARMAMTGVSVGLLAVGGLAQAAPTPRTQVKHVLLLSIDGLHETDLAFYLARHPDSALARLVDRGIHYTRAKTTFPSDSFPGMVAQVTGAGPGTSGVYYDDT